MSYFIDFISSKENFRIAIQISEKFVAKGHIDNKSVFIQGV